MSFKISTETLETGRPLKEDEKRFATRKEANEYLEDLARFYTSFLGCHYTEKLVLESSDPVKHYYENGTSWRRGMVKYF